MAQFTPHFLKKKNAGNVCFGRAEKRDIQRIRGFISEASRQEVTQDSCQNNNITIYILIWTKNVWKRICGAYETHSEPGISLSRSYGVHGTQVLCLRPPCSKPYGTHETHYVPYTNLHSVVWCSWNTFCAWHTIQQSYSVHEQRVYAWHILSRSHVVSG
jgi:hypothetical protein